tara:strand:+ start:69 stop:500 length:432 start_codon:yes stop_codon:yes gene_type:complete
MGRITNVEKARRKALLEQGLKKCLWCKIVKSVDEFCTNNSTIDRLNPCCKECKSRDPNRIESHRRNRIRRQQEFNEYKKTLECIICGYNEDPTKLDHHHRDPATKLFTVSTEASGRGFSKTMLQEIAKCDVLCKQCHADEHGT